MQGAPRASVAVEHGQQGDGGGGGGGGWEDCQAAGRRRDDRGVLHPVRPPRPRRLKRRCRHGHRVGGRGGGGRPGRGRRPRQEGGWPCWGSVGLRSDRRANHRAPPLPRLLLLRQLSRQRSRVSRHHRRGRALGGIMSPRARKQRTRARVHAPHPRPQPIPRHRGRQLVAPIPKLQHGVTVGGGLGAVGERGGGGDEVSCHDGPRVHVGGRGREAAEQDFGGHVLEGADLGGGGGRGVRKRKRCTRPRPPDPPPTHTTLSPCAAWSGRPRGWWGRRPRLRRLPGAGRRPGRTAGRGRQSLWGGGGGGRRCEKSETDDLLSPHFHSPPQTQSTHPAARCPA